MTCDFLFARHRRGLKAVFNAAFYTETWPQLAASLKEIIMSKSHHATHEAKKKPLMTPKAKKAQKLEKRRAAEHQAPEIKIVHGSLKPTSTA
jgi:hypothetical protein